MATNDFMVVASFPIGLVEVPVSELWCRGIGFDQVVSGCTEEEFKAEMVRLDASYAEYVTEVLLTPDEELALSEERRRDRDEELLCMKECS
jgi:hypothetical protein